MSTMLLGYDQNFPTSLNLVCSGVTGYSDKTGDPTNIVYTMVPYSIQTYLGGSVTLYNIVYMSNKDQSWNLGAVRNLSMTLTDNLGTPIVTPLENPINLKFRIVHTSL